MAGTGKQKYIAGLRDLVGGFTLMEQRRHMRMLENLEKAKFEYEKQLRDAQLLEQEAYHQGLLRDKSRDDQRRVAEAGQESRDKLIQGIQRGRVSKNLEAGDTKKAARIAFNRGITLPEHTVKLFSPPDAEKDLTPLADERMAKALGMSLKDYIVWRANVGDSATTPGGGNSDLDKARQIRSNVSTIAGEIAAEKPKTISLEGILKQNRFLPTSEADYAGPSPTRFVPEATRVVPGAGDIPLPTTPRETSQDARASALDAFVDSDIVARTAMSPEEQEELRNSIYSSALYQYLLSASAENYARMTARIRSEGPALFGSWNPKSEFQ